MFRIKHNVLRLARLIESVIGDWFLCINSRGSVYFQENRGKHQDAFDFETVAHSTIYQTIKRVKPRNEDIVFVLGCGKGRALCHFARCKVRKVIGVEISDQLCEIARQNSRSLRRPHAPIEIISEDAVTADLSEGTIFFMANPFGEITLREVLKNIEISHDFATTTVKIIYVVAKYFRVMEEFSWLEQTYEYKRFSGLHVTIYRSCPNVEGCV